MVRELGLTGYLIKPIKKEIFRRLVARTFGIPGFEPESKSVENHNKTMCSLNNIRELSGNDPVTKLPASIEILNSTNDNKEGMHPKVDFFVKQLSGQLKLLEQYIMEKDISEIERVDRLLRNEIRNKKVAKFVQFSGLFR